MDTQKIIDLISNSKKKTIVKAYVNPPSPFVKSMMYGQQFPNGLETSRNIPQTEGVKFFANQSIWIGDYKKIMELIEHYKIAESDYHIEMNHLNSAVPLADYSRYNARIEPGAVIRDMVEIGDGAIVMFGASINIGAKIGASTMIDMNAVLGGRAEVGANCHVGAGAVIAGVIEPASALPVIIEDDVLIGANAVVLEGVRVGKGSVVAAGAIVTKDVEPYTVVAGAPAKVLKELDAKTKSKTEIVNSLRNL